MSAKKKFRFKDPTNSMRGWLDLPINKVKILDTGSKNDAIQIIDDVSTYMIKLANEPDWALYRVQEHVRRKIPKLIRKIDRIKIGTKKTEQKYINVGYAISTTKSLMRTQEHINEIKKKINLLTKIPILIPKPEPLKIEKEEIDPGGEREVEKEEKEEIDPGGENEEEKDNEKNEGKEVVNDGINIFEVLESKMSEEDRKRKEEKIRKRRRFQPFDDSETSEEDEQLMINKSSSEKLKQQQQQQEEEEVSSETLKISQDRIENEMLNDGKKILEGYNDLNTKEKSIEIQEKPEEEGEGEMKEEMKEEEEEENRTIKDRKEEEIEEERVIEVNQVETQEQEVKVPEITELKVIEEEVKEVRGEEVKEVKEEEEKEVKEEEVKEEKEKEEEVSIILKRESEPENGEEKVVE